MASIKPSPIVGNDVPGNVLILRKESRFTGEVHWRSPRAVNSGNLLFFKQHAQTTNTSHRYHMNAPRIQSLASSQGTRDRPAQMPLRNHNL